MTNRLKKFIWDNRNEFDDEVPSEKVWQQVEAAFSEKKKKQSILTPLYKWSMAAAAVLVIGTGAYFIVNKKTGTDGPVSIQEQTTTEPGPEFTPEMKQFAKMISLKQEELKTLAKDQPELYQQFSKDINQLDSSYNILKTQLSATPNREVLLEAMIQNLQLQLNVLNQQLNIINQVKQSNQTVKKI
jgi:hypothetical protein